MLAVRSDWHLSLDYSVSLWRVSSSQCQEQDQAIVKTFMWYALFLKSSSFILWADTLTAAANMYHCVSHGTITIWYGLLGVSSPRQREFTTRLALCSRPLRTSTYDLWLCTVLLSCSWSCPDVSYTRDSDTKIKPSLFEKQWWDQYIPSAQKHL